QVTLWLKKIHGSQPIPQYEVNARTVDILYKLLECNEARDRDVSLLIEDMKEKTAEYKAEANYLQGLLIETLHLSPANLSREGASYLKALVNSAMALNTKDTSLASFFCAINHMTSELYTTESENRELERELTNLRKKLTAALMLEEKLKADLKQTEESLEIGRARADSRSQNLKFLRDKSEDLKIRIKAAEDQLISSGLDQSLTHEALVNLSEKLARVQEELVPLKKKLESYLDLPPVIIFSTVLL
ncbi:HAUS augmin-like complex subunit 1, partial [Egretta garzetta]